MNAKAVLLESLSRDRLKVLVKALQVPDADLRSLRRMREAMLAFEPATPEVLLQLLTETEVLLLNEQLGLTSSQGMQNKLERVREALQGQLATSLVQPSPASSPSSRKSRTPAPYVPAPPFHGSFVALDFETADYEKDSACALAMIRVENDEIVDRTSFLIRPPRKAFVFTYIHGITWPMVARERTFAELWPEIKARLTGVEFLAAHNASFDRTVLMQCCRVAGVMPPDIEFHCTVQLARKTWNLRPTTLPHVCQFLGISLKHHDASSDAEACARIVLAARRAREAAEASRG